MKPSVTYNPSRRRWRLRRLSLSVCMLLMTSLIGCNRTAAPDTVPVSGTVTYNGQPVTSGTVAFQPAEIRGGEGEIQRPAVGVIGSDGRYALSTFEPGDGVVPGDYRVAVLSYADEPTPEEYAEGATRKSAIPEKYTSGQTSGLRTQIAPEASGPIEFDIELKD